MTIKSHKKYKHTHTFVHSPCTSLHTILLYKLDTIKTKENQEKILEKKIEITKLIGFKRI